MAQRRMFSKRVSQTRRFKRMSPMARLLYYELGIAADDDGFVEGFDVCNMNAIEERYLHELADKRYVCELNDDGFCWITCWRENNYIQKDRYRESPYHYLLDDLKTLYPISDIFSTNSGKNNAEENKEIELVDTECIHDGYGLYT